MAEAAEIVLRHEERRRFYAPRDVGCTLCVDKVDRGDGITACAEACLRAG